MIVSGFASFFFFGDLADRGSPVTLPAAPAAPVHAPEKPKTVVAFEKGGGFDGRMKSRILIRLLKEMLTVDQEPTLLLLPPIWQQTQ